MRNDYEIYKARHDECEFYDRVTKTCIRKGNVNAAVCTMFKLTQKATAERYVNARRCGERTGIDYDASRVIYAGYPAGVRRMIDFLMKGKV